MSTPADLASPAVTPNYAERIEEHIEGLPRICLNMIVKNEAAIIERCLRSVAPFITRYEILDTGSTDNTRDVIKSFFEARGIPGLVHRGGFVNFSQARNDALHRAYDSPSSFDYILLVDADMELVIKDVEALKRKSLVSNAYYIKQVAGSMAYDNVRLIHRQSSERSTPLTYRAGYTGVTHEVINVPNTTIETMPRLDEIYFIDHQNGANRADKFARDIKLLTEDLKRDPTNHRSVFYLAETYRYAGDFTSARVAYQQRVEMGGWVEEQWYAQYQLARCWRSLGDDVAFVHAALKAFQMRPTRAEPLWELANHYRLKGENELSLLFLERAKHIPLPSDSLFVETLIHTHGIKEESSIAGFYSQVPEVRKAGYRDCMLLSVDRTAPPAMRALARSNSQHYAKSLEELGVPVARSFQFPEPVDTQYKKSLNPSVVIDFQRDQMLVNVRQVNYTIRPDGSYDYDGVVRTKNVIYKYSLDATKSDWGLESEGMAVVDRTNPADIFLDSPVQGYEDLRLFYRSGTSYHLTATATVRNRNKDFVAEMVLLDLEEKDGFFEIVAVAKLAHDSSRVMKRHEKNWMPMLARDVDDFMMIYSVDPLDLQAYDAATVRRVPCPYNLTYASQEHYALDHLRGSSQAIPFIGPKEQKGFLFVTHETVENPGKPRTYLHRFCWLNPKTRRIEAITDPFYFREKGIEFCAGLANHITRGTLVLSFGVKDREAWIIEVSAWKVFDLLFNQFTDSPLPLGMK